MVKIDKKIAAYEVVKKDKATTTTSVATTKSLPTPTKRPQVLDAKVFKVKSHHYSQAFYVTVGIRYGRPWEIFVNTANEALEMWLKALTRSWSAILRVEEDPTFMIKEMLSIHDPKGGHWSPALDGSDKRKEHKSIIAEMGYILKHLSDTSTISEVRKDIPSSLEQELVDIQLYEESKPICPECDELAIVYSGGCATCTECGYSECS